MTRMQHPSYRNCLSLANGCLPLLSLMVLQRNLPTPFQLQNHPKRSYIHVQAFEWDGSLSVFAAQSSQTAIAVRHCRENSESCDGREVLEGEVVWGARHFLVLEGERCSNGLKF